MLKTPTLFLTVLAALTLGSVSASAQEGVTVEGNGSLGRGLGVGVRAFLRGPAGLSITYDPGKFRIDGILAFSFDSNEDPVDDAFGMVLGAHVLFPLHETSAADFSLGGGIELDYVSAGDSDVDFTFAGLAQIRFFPVSNVAINLTGGLGVTLDGDDGDDTLFAGGQPMAQAGATYFF
jgi:hypothetical protein